MTAAQAVHQTASGSPVDAFRQAIREAGLEPPDEIVADGTLHRFASDGRRGKDAGWYTLYLDGVPAGNFGCWRANVNENWSATSERTMSAAERSAYKAKMDTIRKAREADQAKRHTEAATKAASIWDAAKPATDAHVYLARNGVQVYGLREHTDGRLIVPVRAGKVLQSLQFIDNDNGKLFLAGGEVAGGYFSIGTTTDATALCVCEGFATGATVHEATGYPVAVAFNAGNLKAVTQAMHASYPDLPLIICGDDDPKTKGNPGRTKATEAAQSVGARLALPVGPAGVTDFNDMARHCGVDAVREVMEAARTGEPAAATEEVDKEEKEQKESQASRLAKLVCADAELFYDQHHTPYARVRVDDHYAVLRCKSQAFKRWMVRLFFLAEDRAPGSEAITGALNLIEALAVFEGKQYSLYNRVAVRDGAYWLDLTDKKCRAVKITASGWEIVDEPPILFTRYSHQAPQVEPLHDGDFDKLNAFMSITTDAGKLLIKTWLVSCLVPNIPHPIPVFHGPQGSGKTNFARMLRRLIDPSSVETLSLPREHNELVQTLAHHYVAMFDNVDTLQPWQSDILCRACTGEGFSKRQLFTDDDDIIYSFRRCVGLNGINIAATRADLLDRAILTGLERISSEHRREEDELEAAFVAAKPHILGGILDTFSRAIVLFPSVELHSKPRMADFARWGCAITKALGRKAEDFQQAYDSNIEEQNAEVLTGHPVAAAVMAFMEKTEEWTGRPAELLTRLVEVADKEQIDVKAKLWPKGPQSLSRRLNEVKPNLGAVGIIITTGEHDGVRRAIRLYRENTVNTVIPSAVVRDNDLGTDGMLTVFDDTENTVKVSLASKSLQDNVPDDTDGIDGIIPPPMPDGDLRSVRI